eukprot:9009789-Alexandrium_andersonii.AAC.1
MATRLQQAIGPSLRGTQYGFRAGRSTTDAISVARRAIELAKQRERQALHLVFIDWEKAFDRVHPGAIGAALRRYAVPEDLVLMAEALISSPSFR